MSKNAEDNLARLTLSISRNLVEQEFTCRHHTGGEIVLRLVRAEKSGAQAAASAEAERPFTLLFRGPQEYSMPQGMQNLIHAEFPLAGIFLVPVAGDEGHAWYEAVFT